MIEQIKNGLLVNPQALQNEIAGKKDGFYSITIKRPPSDITTQQHRYYRGAIRETVRNAILDSYGKHYTLDEIHLLIKELHGVRVTIGKTECLKSMAGYTKDDFTVLHTRLEAWLANIFGVGMPDPETWKQLKYGETK